MAQAYRWSFDEIIRLTYPQILMLNHASDVNRKRLDLRIAKRRASGNPSLEDQAGEAMIGGKKLTELTSAEYASYLSRGDGPRPRVIKTKKPDAE